MAEENSANGVESASCEKPDGGICRIREQILRDQVTGLTFQFERDENGLTFFRIYGDILPFGNRQIIFDQDGREAGAGTATGGSCRPSWATNLDDL